MNLILNKTFLRLNFFYRIASTSTCLFPRDRLILVIFEANQRFPVFHLIFETNEIKETMNHFIDTDTYLPFQLKNCNIPLICHNSLVPQKTETLRKRFYCLVPGGFY